MTGLSATQRAFAAAILGRPNDFADRLVEDRLPAAARAQIHANHFRVSLIEALAATFPITHALVGQAYFTQAARGYVLKNPPANPRLNEYGAGFAAWLAEAADLGGHDYLPDVAAFEWALNESYHAEDAAPFAPMPLASAGIAQTRLMLHPATRRLDTPWPVSEIWQVHQPGAGHVERIDLKGEGEKLLVFRSGIDVSWRRLGMAEARLVDALAEGAPLGQATSLASNEAPLDFAASFAWMLEGGVFIEAKTERS